MTTLEKLEDLIYSSIEEAKRRSEQTDRLFQETAQRFRETDRRIEEANRESRKRFEESVEESKRRLEEERKESRRLFDEYIGENRLRTEKLDGIIALFAETDQMQKENARQLDALKKNLKGVTDSLGLFAEQSVKPAMINLFHERGITLTGAYSRAQRRLNGGTMEIDVIADGPEFVVAVEVKMRLNQDHVDEFLEKLPHFFDFFPAYRSHSLYGAVAGMSVDEQVARYAYKHGLFVMVPSGEIIQIWNDEKFVPRVFGQDSAKK